MAFNPLAAITLDGLASPWRYLLNLGVAFLGRMLDVASTRYVTRDMALETNPVARKLGFKGLVLIQLVPAALCGLDIHFAFFVCVWSLFTAGANLEGSWFVREEGEHEHRRKLVVAAKGTPWYKIVLGEINLLMSLVVAGVLVIVFTIMDQDALVIFVSLAMACHGGVVTFRSLQYVRYLRGLEIDETEREVQEKAVQAPAAPEETRGDPEPRKGEDPDV